MSARSLFGLLIYLAAGLLTNACDEPRAGEDPIVLAHKGLVDFAPENSLAAVRETLRAGADGCELDVHLAKTGEVIVLHDPVVNRVSDGEGWVKDLTLDQIKSFRLDPDPAGRYPEERIPTLKEVFKTFGKTAVFFIEMKRPGGMKESNDGMERKVGALIDEYNLYDTTFVSSFNPRALAKIKEAFPKVRTVYEYHQGTEQGHPREAFLEAADEIFALGPSIKVLTPELAAWARERGYSLSTFSPSTLEEMERAAACGCDLVTTGKPELYRMVLAGAFRPEGLEKIPPQFHMRSKVTLPVHDVGGAYLDFSCGPETLYLVMFRFKCESEGEGEDGETRILLVEQEDPADETGRFIPIDPETFTNAGGIRIHPGPSYFGSGKTVDGEGWMRVRFALRTTHKTRSFRLLIGAMNLSGSLHLDDLSVRKL